jgi:hypothetical protein
LIITKKNLSRRLIADFFGILTFVWTFRNRNFIWPPRLNFEIIYYKSQFGIYRKELDVIFCRSI